MSRHGLTPLYSNDVFVSDADVDNGQRVIATVRAFGSLLINVLRGP